MVKNTRCSNWATPICPHARIKRPILQGFFNPFFKTCLGCSLRLSIEALQGDLEYMSQGFGLEVAGSKDPCPFCQASAEDELAWTDARPQAAWRATCYKDRDHEEWLQDHPQACALFRLPGVTNSMVRPDYMHTKHLGVDCYLLGSFFSYCCSYKMQGSVEENMTALWEMIQSTYVEWLTRPPPPHTFPQPKRWTPNISNLMIVVAWSWHGRAKAFCGFCVLKQNSNCKYAKFSSCVCILVVAFWIQSCFFNH